MGQLTFLDYLLLAKKKFLATPKLI